MTGQEFDVEAAIHALLESLRSNRSAYHLNLGELLESLHEYRFRKGIHVKFDTGNYPGKERSYRGYYEDLAFAKSSDAMSVQGFLKICENALGNSYYGYAGGEFVMREDTPLWVAEYGENPEIAIVNCRYDNSTALLILETKYVGDPKQESTPPPPSSVPDPGTGVTLL